MSLRVLFAAFQLVIIQVVFASFAHAARPNAPTLRPISDDPDGNFTVWVDESAPLGRTHYFALYESVNGGSWSFVDSEEGGGSESFSLINRADGSYDFRARACHDDDGCSGWSAIQSMRVGDFSLPESAPNLSVDFATNSSGTIQLSWTLVSNSTRYELFENFSGSLREVYDGAGLSSSVTVTVDGNYEYQVRACNENGCGPYSLIRFVEVAISPTLPTNVNLDAGGEAELIASWDSQGASIYYELVHSSGSGLVYSGSNTSFTLSNLDAGNHSVQLRACKGNISFQSCSDYASANANVVLPLPGVPRIRPLEDDIDGTYTVWVDEAASGGSMHYFELHERFNGGNWVWVGVEEGTGAETFTLIGKADGNYDYRARACHDDRGCSNWSSVRTLLVGDYSVPASAPILSVNSNTSSSGSIQLNWTSVENSDFYEVVEQHSGSSSQVYSGASLNTSATVDSDGDYQYLVRACNDNGCGEFSSDIIVEVALSPNQPSNLSLSEGGEAELNVAWDSQGAHVYFELEHGIGTQFAQVYSGVGTSFTLENLDSGTHTVRLRTCKNVSFVSCSGYVTASSNIVLPPPGTPSIRPLSDDVDGAFTVWVDEAASGGAMHYFELQERFNEGGWMPAGTEEGSGSESFSLINREDGDYEYRARSCHDDRGCSEWSSIQLMRVGDYSLPETAPALSADASSNSSGSIELSWTSVENSNRYELFEYFSGSARKVYDGTAFVSSVSVSIDGNYEYQVRACNDNGCGPYSLLRIIEVVIAPSVPSNLALTQGGDAELVASWNSQAENIYFELVHNTGSGLVYSGTATSYTLSDLDAGVHTVGLRACKGASFESCSAYANTSAAVILPIPGVPSIRPLSDDVDGAYTVWVDHASSGGPMHYFELGERFNDGDWIFAGNELGSGSESFNLTGKEAGDYDYRVRACHDDRGCSNWSAISSMRVGDFSLPETAPELSSDSSTNASGTVQLNWTSVANSNNYELIQYYGGSSRQIYSGPNLSSTAIVETDGNYEYQVRACNDNGCGPQSLLRIVTVAIAPGAPSNLSLESQGDDSILASWDSQASGILFELDLDTGGGFTNIYTGPDNSFSSGDINAGLHRFRARACKNVSFESCSAYSTASISIGSSNRITDSLIVDYDFIEGSGTSILDKSGFGSPLNLTIQNEGAVEWLACGGLRVNSNTLIPAIGSASKIYDAVVASDEISIEAWVTPENLSQTGPARIVTFSADSGNRNFTLGQDGQYIVGRLRTTESGHNGNNPQLYASDAAQTQLSHFVYTRDTWGNAKLYINGQLAGQRGINGETTNWNETYTFALADEINTGRRWLGDYHRVAVYSKSLSEEEVQTNYSAGIPNSCANPPANQVPIAINDVFNTTVDVSPAISVVSLLSNDSDPDGDELSVTAVTDPYNGTADLIGNEVVFVLDSGFTGTAGFNYTISDGNGGTASAPVLINVVDSGSVSFDERFEAEDATLFNNIVRSNRPSSGDLYVDIDDSNPLEWTISVPVDGEYQLSVAYALDGSNRPMAFLINGQQETILDFSDTGTWNDWVEIPHTTVLSAGQNTIRLEETGSSGPNIDYLDVTILSGAQDPNEPPVASDDFYSTEQDVAVEILITDLLNDDSDQDGDVLSFVGVTNETNGTISQSADTLTFTPNAGFTGPAYFDYEISDGLANAMGRVYVSVSRGDTRVSDGLVLMYDFTSGSGDTVYDVSSFGSAINLTIEDPSRTEWLSCGGLSVTGNTIISSPLGHGQKVYNAITDSGDVTLEAWIAPGHTSQYGPSRIFTLSQDSSARNFTLGQEGTAYDWRLRTSTTGNNGSGITVRTNGVLTPNLTHVVMTRSGTENISRIYVNGILERETTVSGDFSSWDDNFGIALANEYGNARHWRGDFYLVAAYSKALSESEIARNYEYGAGADCSGLNNAPLAELDTIYISSSAQIEIPVVQLTSNDSDPDGDSLQIVSVFDAQNGSVMLSGSNVVFEVDEHFTGDAYFDYLVSDGNGGVDIATVAIVVSAAAENHPANPEIVESQALAQFDDSVVSQTEVRNLDKTIINKGMFSVSESGAATYGYPIYTPAGTAGHTPELSLAYSSHMGDGIAGIGWSLSGMASIERCRQTSQQDANPMPITWTDKDRFCLNGKRLIKLNDGTYRPENDNSIVVHRAGSESNPDFFTAQYPNGVVQRFGAPSDSTAEWKGLDSSSAPVDSAIYRWMVTTAWDQSANQIQYSYTQDHLGIAIVSIDYGFDINLNRMYRINFDYDVRVDPKQFAVAGYQFPTKRILTSITVENASGEILRGYELGYDRNHDLNDPKYRLTDLRQFSENDLGNRSFLKTLTFDWNQASTGYEDGLPQMDLSPRPGQYWVQRIVPGDIDGDGSTDFVLLTNDSRLRYILSDGGEFVETSFADGSEFLQIDSESCDYCRTSPIRPNWQIQLGDFNGDGRDDLILGDTHGSTNQDYLIYLSKADAVGNWRLSADPLNANIGELFLSWQDVDSDGLPDYLRSVPKSIDSDGAVPIIPEVHLQSRKLKAKNNLTHGPTPYEFEEEKENTPILVDQGNGEFYVMTSGEHPHDLAPNTRGGADFNGDGITDILLRTFQQGRYSCDRGSDGKYLSSNCSYQINRVPFVKVYLDEHDAALPSGGEPGFYYKPYGVDNLKDEYWMSSYFVLSDINSDGLSDILYLHNLHIVDPWDSSLINYGGGDWYYVLNTGAGFSDPVLLVDSIGLASDRIGIDEELVRHDTNIQLVDINQDGYKDFVYFEFQEPRVIWDDPESGGDEVGPLKVKYWQPDLGQYSGSVNFCPMGVTHCEFNYEYFPDAGYFAFDGPLGIEWNFEAIPNSHFYDVNGDGRLDYIHYQSVNETSSYDDLLQVFLAKEESKVDDVIHIIHESNGKTITIEYEQLSSSQHYASLKLNKDTSCIDVSSCWQAQFEVNSEEEFYKNIAEPFEGIGGQGLGSLSPVSELVNGPMALVTAVHEQTPSADPFSPDLVDENSVRSREYFYAQAKLQGSGRGYLGFKFRKIVDLHTGIETLTEFRQDFPFIGKVAQESVRSQSGALLSHSEYDWGITGWDDTWPSIAINQGTSKLGDGDFVPMPYVIEARESTYLLVDNGYQQGNKIGELVSRNENVDQYANAYREVQIYFDEYGAELARKTTEKTYNSLDDSRKRKTSRLQVTDQRGGASITRTSAYTYYSSSEDHEVNGVGLIKEEIIEPDNPSQRIVTTHFYDEFGNKVRSSLQDALGNTRVGERLEFDSHGVFVNNTYDYFYSSGQTESPQEHLVYQVLARDKFGNPMHERTWVDANNSVDSYTSFSPFGQAYYHSSGLGGYQISLAQNYSGVHCPSHTDRYMTQRDPTGAFSVSCLDLSGNVIRKSFTNFNGGLTSEDFEYDLRGKLIRKTEPYLANDQKLWVEYSYDLLGRESTQSHPFYGVTTTEYSPSSDVNSVYKKVVTNDELQAKVSHYNALSEMVRVDDDSGFSVFYHYDAGGYLSRSEDADGVVTTILNDAYGRKLSMLDPSTGLSTHTYNAFGELESTSNASAITTRYEYDAKGRVIEKEIDHDGILSRRYWAFDAGIGAFGKPVISGAIESDSVTQANYYDALGRLSVVHTTQNIAELGTTHNYEKQVYDALGRVHRLFDAARDGQDWSNNILEKRFNEYGYEFQWAEVNGDGSTENIYSTIHATNARNSVESVSLGDNVIQQHSVYSPASGLLQSQVTSTTGTILYGNLQNRSYEWDSLGNLSSRSETGLYGSSHENSVTQRNLSEEFEYDNINRLTVNRLYLNGQQQWQRETQYHDNGNIAFKAGVGTYQYNAASPYLVSSAGADSYNYDELGRLDTDTLGRSFDYNHWGNLSSVSSSGRVTHYQYDAANDKAYRKDVDSSGDVIHTQYIGSVEVVHHSDGKIEWKRYIGSIAIVTQTLEANVVTDKKKRYLLTDHLGSISHIIDDFGFLIESMDFDPWGSRRNLASWENLGAPDLVGYFKASNPTTSKGYTGHEMVDEHRIIHMGGRIYDPVLARFLHADPLVGSLEDIQRFNRYSYVSNNPLNKVDPSGFDEKEIAEQGDTDAGNEETMVVTGRKESEQGGDAEVAFTFPVQRLNGDGEVAFVSTFAMTQDGTIYDTRGSDDPNKWRRVGRQGYWRRSLRTAIAAGIKAIQRRERVFSGESSVAARIVKGAKISAVQDVGGQEGVEYEIIPRPENDTSHRVLVTKKGKLKPSKDPTPRERVYLRKLNKFHEKEHIKRFYENASQDSLELVKSNKEDGMILNIVDPAIRMREEISIYQMELKKMNKWLGSRSVPEVEKADLRANSVNVRMKVNYLKSSLKRLTK